MDNNQKRKGKPNKKIILFTCIAVIAVAFLGNYLLFNRGGYRDEHGNTWNYRRILIAPEGSPILSKATMVLTNKKDITWQDYNNYFANIPIGPMSENPENTLFYREDSEILHSILMLFYTWDDSADFRKMIYVAAAAGLLIIIALIFLYKRAHRGRIAERIAD